MALDLDAIAKGDFSGIQTVGTTPSGNGNAQGAQSLSAPTDGSYLRASALPAQNAFSSDELQADHDYETSDSVKAKLQSAIVNEKDPKKRSILQDAYNKDFGASDSAPGISVDKSKILNLSDAGATGHDQLPELQGMLMDRLEGRQNQGKIIPDYSVYNTDKPLTDFNASRAQQEDRQRRQDDSSILGDTAKLGASGVVGGSQLITSLGYATTGLDAFKNVGDKLGEWNKSIEESESPDQQDANQLKFGGDASGKNNALYSPRAVLNAVMNGIGSAIPTVAAGALFAAGGDVVVGVAGLDAAISIGERESAVALKNALASGMDNAAATQAAKDAGQKAFAEATAKAQIPTNYTLEAAIKATGVSRTAGYTASGMAFSAGDAANAAMEETKNFTPEQKMQSPEYQALLKQNIASGMSDQQAMASADDEIEKMAGRYAAAHVLAGDIPFDLVLGHTMGALMHGGLGQASRLKNFALAAGEQVPAGAAKLANVAWSGNLGAQVANPNQDEMENVEHSAWQGGVGALGTSVPHLLSTPVPQPNSPLTNAANAAASHSVPPAAEDIGGGSSNAQPPSSGGGAPQATASTFGDPALDQKYVELGAFISNRDNIASMRQQDPSFPAQAFHVWGVINDTELPMQTRVNALNQAYSLASGRTNFTMPKQAPETFERTPTSGNTPATANPSSGPAAQTVHNQGDPLGATGNIIDGEFSHETNPTALPRTALPRQSLGGGSSGDQSNSSQANLLPAAEPQASPDIMGAIHQVSNSGAVARQGAIRELVNQGFTTVTKGDDGLFRLSHNNGTSLTLQSPADVQVARNEIKKRIDAGAHEAATSTSNSAPAPTDAQIAAENYKKGHINLHGLDIAIENPQGSIRRGVDQSGNAWESHMQSHYGYIKRTNGADGDAVDAFVGPRPDSDKVFVVDQKNPETGAFDEHKVMLGYTDEEAARRGYQENYHTGWNGLGHITELSMPAFKDWLKSGDTTQPVHTEENHDNTNQDGRLRSASEEVDGNRQRGPIDAAVVQGGEHSDEGSAQSEDRGNAGPSAGVQDRNWIRPEIEGLIHQKRFARQVGRGGQIEKLIDLAKRYMAGEDIKPARFKSHAVAFSKEPAILEIVNRIHDRIKDENNRAAADARNNTRANRAKEDVPAVETEEVQANKATRTVQRQLFNLAANADSLIDAAGKSPEEFERTSKAYVEHLISTLGGDIAETSIEQLPPEFWAAVQRRAQSLAAIAEKENARDPEIYKDALAKAIVDAGIDTSDQPAMDALKEGFDHALKGKSKSTLSSDGDTSAKLAGYDAAWSWIKTPDGKSWYEGKRHRKLQDTGADLRRWFEQSKKTLDDLSDNDPSKVMALVKKVTERAKVFDVKLGDEATPGARAWVEELRSNIRTFGDWITSHGMLTNLYGDAWKRGDHEKILNFLKGTAYTHGDAKGPSDKWTEEERADAIKLASLAWIQNINPLLQALSGANTIAELAERLKSYAFEDGKTLSDAGSTLKYNLMTKRRLDRFLPDGYITEELQAKENQAATSNRAKPLVPPRLYRITRTGLNDHRNGKDVTPQEFKDKFDFADVGFGKWVGAKQDQDHLNYAYDAFMDLVNLLGIDPKDIGFRGKLHFTIGALGHGKHAAHFAHGQPHPNGKSVEVINLTNTKGDGTVAHEWFHALDYYLGGGTMTADNGVQALVYRLSRGYDHDYLNTVPKLFLERGYYYKGLGRNTTKLDHAKHAISYGDYGRAKMTQYKADADELGKDYWGNDRELLARAAEAWIFDTLGERRNNYLVNDWVADGSVSKDTGYRGRMYPAADERKRFATYFDAFIKAIDWTEDGPKLDFDRFKNALPDEQAEFQKAKKDLLDQLPSIWDGIQAQQKAENLARLDRIEPTDNEAARALEDQRRRDEMRRQMEAEASAATAAVHEAADHVDGPLSREELEALFDEAEAELSEETQEQPDAPNPGDNLSAVDGAASADYSDTRAATPEERQSASAMAMEAAKLGVNGIDEVMTGLVKLFGSGNGKLQSFPGGFDQETYEKAKPHFEKALEAFVSAGKTLKDLLKFLIQQFGAGVRPYAIQFAAEKGLGAKLTQEGKDNAVSDEKQVGTDDNAGHEDASAGDVPGAVGGREAEGSGAGPSGRRGGDLRDDLHQVEGGDPAEGESRLHDAGTRPDDGRGASEQRGDQAGNGVSAGRSDYTAATGSLTRQGSWKETASRNLDIIELVKRLDTEGRLATPEEQALLAKYTGFGASDIRNRLFSPNAFSHGEYRPGWVGAEWRDVAERAAAILSKDELNTMLQSTQYAHYTSERVIRSIWNGLNRIGFSGGRMIEPGSGIGLFAVAAPKDVMDRSHYTGVEMDHMTASIAKQLLQRENIIQGDFVKQKLPDGFFDVAIGNPPFSTVRIKDDPAYKKYGFALHDYFFAKSIDKVRPGGLLVFVTSRGTMDKNGDKARQFIAERANLLGAVRLPQTAFKDNAGTEVVTDVLFLQKRMPGQERSGNNWMDLAEVATAEGQKHLVNQYFAEHPEMVLGSHSTTGSMYRSNEYTVLPREGDIETHFDDAIKNLPAGVYANAKPADVTRAETVERDFSPKAKKEGSIYVSDSGKLMRRENGVGVPLESAMKLSARESVWLSDYVGLRSALKQAQYDQLNDGHWEDSLKELNKQYDSFVKKNGNINDFTAYERSTKDEEGNETTTEYRRYKNNRLLRADVEGPLVEALERITEDGAIVKAPILLERTIKRPARPEINTLQDALMVSLDEQGRLNLDHVAELAKMTKDKVIGQLGDLIYESPNGEWQMSDEYLSGDVLEKLDEAEHAAKTDTRFERNVKALLLVQPKPLTAAQIHVPLGANWVPETVITRFATDALDIYGDVTYNQMTNVWTVPGADGSGSRRLRSASGDWSTSDRSANEILDDVLNARQIKITKTIEDDEGKKKTIADPAATAAVNEIASKMRNAFASWVWTDSGRAENLTALYNRKFNNIAPRVFDGRHLTLPGLSLRYKLFDHQKRAIWRVIQTGNTYLAHAVGAGKTLEMIVSGMEQKRLGLINKPMYVVPNHMLEQFSSEFLDAYPTANIMVADEENFSADNRRRFVSQAALNNPDAIVITHSAFGLIRTTQETNDVVVDEIITQLHSAAEEEGDKRKRAKIEAQIENIKRRFDSKVDESKKDNHLNFEELGVDFLYVDEAHEFRKLDFATNRQQIKGIDPNGSQKALGLFIKMRWLNSQRPGRSGVLASGTPVTNTMAELFSVMRYMMPDELQKIDLDHFDAWANMFGQVASEYEMNAAGKYEIVERFSKFVNVPELMKRIRMFMDVLTSSQLGNLVQRPTLKDGGPQNVVVNPSDAVLDYLRNVLTNRIETSRKWKPTPGEKGNPDPLINIITDGRLSAIDMRFVDKNAPNDPGSKLNVMIDNIIDRHNRYKDLTYTDKNTGEQDALKGATQIIFSAVGFGDQVAKNRGFDAKAWITKRLKDAGITDLAFMGDHNTAAKKESLFKDMRSGKTRQLYGSPRNMGTGVNVQKRLKALHFLSPPWFPADVEQPHGRIERQGNQNSEVEIMWYATKGTYDSTAWSMNARKARFIEQAFMGDDSVRSMEDVSEASQYEMASALAAGDERAIQLAGYKADIERLSRLKEAHAKNQIDLRHRKADLEFNLKFQQDREEKLTESNKLVGGYVYGDALTTEFNGAKLVKRADIGDAMLRNADSAIKAWKARNDDDVEPIQIGTVMGKFPLVAKMRKIYAEGAVNKRINGASLWVQVGQLDFPIEENSQPSFSSFDPSGLATRLNNALNGIDRKLSEAQNHISSIETEMKQVVSKLGAPFPEERELNDKIAESARLQDDMAKGGEAVPSDEALLAMRDAKAMDSEAPAEDLSKYRFRRMGEDISVADNADDVTIPGLEKHKFYIIKDGNQYHVINDESGLSIGTDSTIKGARQIANDRLEKHGANFISSQIAKRIITDDQKRAAVKAYRSGQMDSRKPAEFNGQDTKLTAAWKILAGNDEIFKYPVSESKDLVQVFHEVSKGMVYAINTNERALNATKVWRVYPVDNKTKAPMFDQEGSVYLRPNGTVQIDVSRWKEGSGGSAVYASVGNWAYNTGKVFAGDDNGISPTGMLRRLENMISLALKFGTTDFISPHELQLNTLGFKWKVGDTEFNLDQMLMRAFTALRDGVFTKKTDHGMEVTEASPDAKGLDEISDVVYDFENHEFKSISDGKPVTEADFRDIADAPRARAAKAGVSTLKRAAITNTILRSQGGREWGQILGSIVRLSREHLDALRGINYSKDSAQAEGSTPDAIRAAFVSKFGERAIRQLESNGTVNIVESAADLPQGVTTADTTKAIFIGDKAYFIADRMDPDTAHQELLHEIGEHYGLGRILGAEGYQNLMNRVSTMHAQGDKDVVAAWNFVANEYQHLQAGSRQFMQEVLAQLGQNAEIKGHSLIKGLVDAFKRFLVKLGFTGMIRVSDIQAMVVHSLKTAAGEDGGGPRGGKAMFDDAQAMDSRGNYANGINVDSIKAQVQERMADAFNTKRTFNSWWHRSVGTQYHKAQIDQDFGRVYNLAQTFIDDLARYANTAADKAPNLLPQIETFRDSIKGLFTVHKDSADAKAIADPIFQGTLSDKIYSDDELRGRFGLNDDQVELYHEFRNAVNQSLDDLAISEMGRLAKTEGLHLAPEGSTLAEATAFYRSQFEADLERANQAMEDLKERQKAERKLLEDAANDEASSAEKRKRYADMLIGMNKRHEEEAALAKDALDNLKQLDKGINDRFNGIEKLKGEGYAPLTRFGNYTVDVFLDDGTGKPIKDASGEDIRHYFGMFESEAEANKMARLLQEEYPGAKVVHGVLSQEASQLFRGVTPDTVELYARMAGEDQSEAFQKYLKMAVNNRSAMKRLIKRTGVKGFSEDPSRVLASFITSNARAASSNDHFGDMLKASAEIPREKGDVKDEAVKLMQYIQNPQEEASQLRGLLFINYLGGSVASAMVNMTQPIMMTLPYLNQFSGKAGLHLAWAMKVAGKRVFGKDIQLNDKPMMDALNRAKDEGVVSPNEVHMLYGESMRAGFTNNRWIRNLTKAWGSLFGLAEGFNRYATFMAAYKIAEEKGMTPDEAYEFSKQAVYETQGVYSKANRPNWARGAVGATLFTFKQFSISYLEFLKRLPAKERALALGILVLAAGVQGLPFSDDIDDMVDTLAQSLGLNWNTKQEKRDFLAKLFGKEASGYVMYGISNGLPLDVAGRMSAGNVIPGTGIFKKSEMDKTSDVTELSGAIGGVATNAMTAVKDLQSGAYKDAAKAMAPKAISDAIKALDMAQTGKMHDSKGRVIADATPADAFIKALGFQPTTFAQASRERGILLQNENLLKQTQSNIYERWAQGVAEGDTDKISSAMSERDRWNSNNPDDKIMIKMSNVMRRANAMRQSADQRFMKAAPKSMKNDVAAALTE